jgi:hypothetical protein
MGLCKVVRDEDVAKLTLAIQYPAIDEQVSVRIATADAPPRLVMLPFFLTHASRSDPPLRLTKSMPFPGAKQGVPSGRNGRWRWLQTLGKGVNKDEEKQANYLYGGHDFEDLEKSSHRSKQPKKLRVSTQTTCYVPVFERNIEPRLLR